MMHGFQMALSKKVFGNHGHRYPLLAVENPLASPIHAQFKTNKLVWRLCSGLICRHDESTARMKVWFCGSENAQDTSIASFESP